MVEMKEKKLVPIKCDMVFKKMWGDPDNLDRLAALLSIILKIPYEKIKGNIEIIESEKRVTNYKEKINRCDVVARVRICSLGKVNLEMNLGFDKTDIERNLGFISYLFSSYLRSGEDYLNIKPIIQLNFNDYDIDSNNKDVIDIYMMMNKNGNILTDKLQMYEINIEKCLKIWYDGDIEKYKKLDREIIKVCALMDMTEDNLFMKCLGEIDMDENVKKDIEATERLLSAEETIMAYYGSEEEQRKREKWRMQNAIDIATKEGTERGLKQGIEQGIEQGSELTQREIAKKMLDKTIPVELIMELTNLTQKEIESLR